MASPARPPTPVSISSKMRVAPLLRGGRRVRQGRDGTILPRGDAFYGARRFSGVGRKPKLHALEPRTRDSTEADPVVRKGIFGHEHHFEAGVLHL